MRNVLDGCESYGSGDKGSSYVHFEGLSDRICRWIDMVSKRMRGAKGATLFSLSHWKNRVTPSTEIGKRVEEIGLGGNIRISLLTMLCFKYVWHFQKDLK